MTNEERIMLIRQRLDKAFDPTELVIRDDSAAHHGHVGSKGGAGHFSVRIAAGCFQGLSRVMVHQKIYGELSDLIPGEIHALSIQVINEGES